MGRGSDLSREYEERISRPYETWAMAAVTLAAFILRVQRLDVAPPAFGYDEAARAVAALDLLQGQHALMAQHLPGVTALFPYLTAGAFESFGVRAVSQRLLAAFFSTLAVPLTYALTRMWFQCLGRRAAVVGALAALGLATAYWQVHAGRVGLEKSLIPAVLLLCLIALWRGLEQRQARYFALSGALIGLGLWLDPMFCFALLLASLLMALFPPTRPARPGLLHILAFALGLLVVSGPLLAHFTGHREEFLRWGTEAFFLRPTVHGGDPLGTLLRSAAGTVLAFGLTGDPSPASNWPGRPLLDPAMALLFWAGLVLSLRRWRQRPFACCVLWWAVMTMSAVLMPDRVPHFGRLMGVGPVVYVFPALTIDMLAQAAQRTAIRPGRWQRFASLAMGVALLCVLEWTAVSTHHDYFNGWARSVGAYRAFHGPDRELAEQVNQDGPDVVYLLPYDVLWTPEPHAVLRFFHNDDAADFVTIHLNELDVPRQLKLVTAGKRIAKWVRMAQGKAEFLEANADPKGLLGFYLEQHGELIGRSVYAGGEVWAYRLPDGLPDFGRPLQFLGHGVAFERQLWLVSSAMGNASQPAFNEGNTIRAGDTLWLVVQWEPLNPNVDDYLARLRLVNGAGRIVAEAEHRLLDDVHRPSSHWVKRDIPVLDFCLFPMPPDLSPGEYTLEVGVYAPLRGDCLSIHGMNGQQFFPIRTVQVDGN
jgi:4-amino-4-deoxy-L-arabinose transferase-like glycosyltransferase